MYVMSTSLAISTGGDAGPREVDHSGILAPVQLTKTFTPEQYARALESWAWIGLEGKEPVFTSLFGDVFLRSADGWWYLSTIEGSLTLDWPTEAALRTGLQSQEAQDRYLSAVFAMAAARRGLTLEPAQVYDFVPPP